MFTNAAAAKKAEHRPHTQKRFISKRVPGNQERARRAGAPDDEQLALPSPASVSASAAARSARRTRRPAEAAPPSAAAIPDLFLFSASVPLYDTTIAMAKANAFLFPDSLLYPHHAGFIRR